MQSTVDSKPSDMRGSEGIQAELADCKARLQEEYPISALGVFGSYARGDRNRRTTWTSSSSSRAR